jgi:hypothetical protein
MRNVVKKFVLLSSLSGVSYYLGRKSVENCLETVSEFYKNFNLKTKNLNNRVNLKN